MAGKETEALAIRGISLVTDAIAKDFNLTVKMGGELEFCALPLAGRTFADPDNPLGISAQGKYPDFPKPFFENSPHIINVYKKNAP